MRAKLLRRDGTGHPVDIVDAHRCDSKSHAEPVLATWRLHWVTGQVEYCDFCRSWMQEVARIMGMTVREERLAVPAPVAGRRAMDLERSE